MEVLLVPQRHNIRARTRLMEASRLRFHCFRAQGFQLGFGYESVLAAARGKNEKTTIVAARQQ